MFRFQAQVAIDEADLILFMVDQKTGLLQDDELIAQMLRQSGKEVIVVSTRLKTLMI